jgi:hypothetical protein
MLLSFHKEHGHCGVSFKADKKALGGWVDRQRKLQVHEVIFQSVGSNNWIRLVFDGALKSNISSSGENNTNSSNPSRRKMET